MEKKHIPPLSFHILTKFYDLSCELVGLGTGFKRNLLNKTEIKDGTKILDLGCGTGVLTIEAKKMFPKSTIIGIDPDKNAIKIANQRKIIGVNFILSGGEKLPFKNDNFDYIVSSLTFHHMPIDIKKKALQESYRVLKKKGIMYIFDFKPKKKKWWNFWTFIEAEYTRDNYEGKIHEIATNTGFSIKQIDTKYGILELIELRKK